MKALVISDRQEIIEFVTPLLKNKGFDIIHYRWIIKALDNIEEIQPDLILLSPVEYPRHWKTLAGFVQSGIGGNDVKLFLYEEETLTDEEAKKADELGIKSFTKDFCDEDKGLDVELAFNEDAGPLHFTNGKYFPKKNVIQLSEKVSAGRKLKYVSLFDGENVLSFSADVEENDGLSSLRVKEL